MSNEVTAATNRFTKSIMAGLRKEMDLKIEALDREQAKLMEALNSGFNADDFRRLNIVNQHLQVANSRRKGDWLKGDYPECLIISKSKT